MLYKIRTLLQLDGVLKRKHMSPTHFTEICDSGDLENKIKGHKDLIIYYGPHNDVFVPNWSYSGH